MKDLSFFSPPPDSNADRQQRRSYLGWFFVVTFVRYVSLPFPSELGNYVQITFVFYHRGHIIQQVKSENIRYLKCVRLFVPFFLFVVVVLVDKCHEMSKKTRETSNVPMKAEAKQGLGCYSSYSQFLGDGCRFQHTKEYTFDPRDI